MITASINKNLTPLVCLIFARAKPTIIGGDWNGKNIVENATSKANEGKNISFEMIQGYTELLENIEKQSQTINEIANLERRGKELQKRVEDLRHCDDYYSKALKKSNNWF